MSWQKEYVPGVRKTTLGSGRGSSMRNKPLNLNVKSSTYDGATKSIHSSYSFQNQDSQSENNLGFSSLSLKSKGPRRSLLGRRFTQKFPSLLDNSKEGEAASSSSFSSIKPRYFSSPKNDSSREMVTPKKMPKTPSHPFPDLDNSSFFENGISKFTTWSIFKTGANNRGLQSPLDKKPFTKLQFKPVMSQSTSVSQKPNNYNSHQRSNSELVYDDKSLSLDNSLGTLPLDLIKQNNSFSFEHNKENHKLLHSASKGKKLSVVKEEGDSVMTELPKTTDNIHYELLNKWNLVKKECDTIRKEYDEKLKKMENVAEEILEALKYRCLKNNCTSDVITKTSPTTPNDSIDKSNETIIVTDPVTPCDSFSLMETTYSNFKTFYSYLKPPQNKASVKNSSSKNCYTPKSLSSSLKQQMKQIYGEDI
ncbi:uncharacterized protein LOC106674206 [Cimex lectularius]|uniref:Uncharacterized protein n=1 Tax=Cimex lectularius TaxID=79782 RepID=A0A8I6SD96_CIMLE|nr:uncharacterized protein LOC106674206 [Cimex lectularius]